MKKKSDVYIFIALGIAFWFSAAMIVRVLGDAVLTENNPYLPVMFAVIVPITLAFMYITRLVSGYQFHELLKPFVVMTATATFFDGVALIYFTELYANSYEVALHGAALILFGAGMGLLFTYYLEERWNAKAS